MIFEDNANFTKLENYNQIIINYYSSLKNAVQKNSDHKKICDPKDMSKVPTMTQLCSSIEAEEPVNVVE